MTRRYDHAPRHLVLTIVAVATLCSLSQLDAEQAKKTQWDARRSLAKNRKQQQKQLRERRRRTAN